MFEARSPLTCSRPGQVDAAQGASRGNDSNLEAIGGVKWWKQ